jgi:hypothetical protein|eukprot:COSAG01_NODE_3447_length_6079_cov_12.927343_6_plen_37_part_00
MPDVWCCSLLPVQRGTVHCGVASRVMGVRAIDITVV